ncbi:M1 family aminopeptidase [soil metagenome]
MKPCKWAYSRVLAALLMLLLVGSSSVSALQATPTQPDLDWPPVSDGGNDSRFESLSDLTRYLIEVSFDYASNRLEGSVRIDFTNFTGVPLAAIPVRLYPNAAYYGEGGTVIQSVTVDNLPADGELSVQDTVLTIGLGRLLPDGGLTTIIIDFLTIVPVDSAGSFGIFSHDADRSMWILADWYPIVAGWDREGGFQLKPPTLWGDPTFSNAAVYQARIDVPNGLELVSTGRTIGREELPARAVHVIETGPVREFAMVIDDGFRTFEQYAGETLVRLSLDGASDDELAWDLLHLAAKALESYGQRYGLYPYDELDIVQTELASALGVSWSGIVFMDSQRLASALDNGPDLDDALVFTLIHEIGHQWWGGIVGVNSNDYAFMNESVTNYSTIVVYDDLFGEEAAVVALRRWVAQPYLAMLESTGDGVVSTSIDDVDDAVAFGRLIYGKGALGMLAIRLAIGDDAFFSALRSYADDHSFGIATPADLMAAFESASGFDLALLWRMWFEEARTTPLEVEQLMDAAA